MVAKIILLTVSNSVRNEHFYTKIHRMSLYTISAKRHVISTSISHSLTRPHTNTHTHTHTQIFLVERSFKVVLFAVLPRYIVFPKVLFDLIA